MLGSGFHDAQLFLSRLLLLQMFRLLHRARNVWFKALEHLSQGSVGAVPKGSQHASISDPHVNDRPL